MTHYWYNVFYLTIDYFYHYQIFLQKKYEILYLGGLGVHLLSILFFLLLINNLQKYNYYCNHFHLKKNLKNNFAHHQICLYHFQRRYYINLYLFLNVRKYFQQQALCSLMLLNDILFLKILYIKIIKLLLK